MDTLESVMLRLNPRLIPCICMVASMDIMDMLDTHTPMDTMDTLDRYEHHQMNLTQKLDTNAFFFSNLPSIFQCLTLIQGLGAGNVENLYFYNCN